MGDSHSWYSGVAFKILFIAIASIFSGGANACFTQMGHVRSSTSAGGNSTAPSASPFLNAADYGELHGAEENYRPLRSPYPCYSNAVPIGLPALPTGDAGLDVDEWTRSEGEQEYMCGPPAPEEGLFWKPQLASWTPCATPTRLWTSGGEERPTDSATMSTYGGDGHRLPWAQSFHRRGKGGFLAQYAPPSTRPEPGYLPGMLAERR